MPPAAGRGRGAVGTTAATDGCRPFGRSGSPRPQPRQSLPTSGRTAGRDCGPRGAGGDRPGQTGALERDVGALERLGLPAVETIARFDRCIAEAKSAISRTAARRERASSDATGVDRELEGLRLAGEVPSEVELADARRLRESGWHLVRNDWRKEPLEAADLDGFSGRGGRKP